MISRVVLVFIFIVPYKLSFAQDTLISRNLKDLSTVNPHIYRLNYKKLILPSALIAAGSISFAIPTMKKWDVAAKLEVAHDRPWTTTLDNYTQYFPAVMVYGLNLYGIKGRHNFRDRSIIYASSQLISAAIVTPTKNLVGEERPNGSNNKSFPSGHAATAFSTAHFMYREYRDNNILLSLSGYPFALFTGVYRVFNNKHWMTDVVAGAGVGILSTEISYWLYPKINAVLGGGNKNRQSVVMPYYQSQYMGLSYLLIF
ncbi:phosphatase PAP2 family protein [Elizabethkingia anophelis]|jgi:membrane-associated phospholipid phosphatase|uniref:phosphatase PAP2 family protein n=1 Tax=Elizabethkingia anophelis TaxID=1117645 RepID=UPI0021A4DA97|nr:phosphatase PAP2 family protein [Elizabethkingia anophelis]MDV4069966.1 PA-phosphatase [Elizabethkingia anophelis]